ncbi:hypothetical protein H0E87_016931 [Populus deltoides]|uniref:RRM domain-containing protein n=1 Tax=Populus deltoides TaxID=3696 RepID=A0A8T2XYG9_POPDE|nr:hypothetical protein H0E87_016931 [Populus deltoides]
MKCDLELLAFTSHLQSLHNPVYSFAAGLSFSSTEKKIAEAFSEFGEVIEAKIVMDKARKRPKGYGFVTFARKDAAEKACEGMNGKRNAAGASVQRRILFFDAGLLVN